MLERARRPDCQPNLKKLTELEEEAITGFVLELASRGFPPSLNVVREMANKLLAARGAGVVGNRWPQHFVDRTESLTTRFNRPYDYQRALCEDPVIIREWFEKLQRVQAEQGILDEDTYNFDESGFRMGKITSSLVVTGSEIRRSKPMALQPGNREWATVILGINAAGWAIPPYIIIAAKYHLSAWYEEESIPQDWVLVDGWDDFDGAMQKYKASRNSPILICSNQNL